MNIPAHLQQKLIVALDVETVEEALKVVRELKPYVTYFKVGLELINRAGAPAVIQALRAEKVSLFFDGKFHDIPNTVAKAVEAVTHWGVDILNVHASSGIESLKAAVQKKDKALLFAVSVLTSITEAECQRLYRRSISEVITDMTQMILEIGLDGIICSPQEIDLVRKVDSAKKLKIMTPGIRPAWSEVQDQKRTLTPREAIEKGVDFIVVGRPILKPKLPLKSPEEAVQKLWKEILE